MSHSTVDSNLSVAELGGGKSQLLRHSSTRAKISSLLGTDSEQFKRQRSLSFRGPHPAFGIEALNFPMEAETIKSNRQSSIGYHALQKMEERYLREQKRLRRNTFAMNTEISRTMQSLNGLMSSLEDFLSEHPSKDNSKQLEDNEYDSVLDVIDIFGGGPNYNLERSATIKSLKNKLARKKSISKIKNWAPKLQASDKILPQVEVKRSKTMPKMQAAQFWAKLGRKMGKNSPSNQPKESIDVSAAVEEVANPLKLEQMDPIPQPLLNIVPQNLIKTLDEKPEITTEDVCDYIHLHRKRTKEFNTKVMSEVFGDADKEKDDSILNVQKVADLCEPVADSVEVVISEKVTLQDAVDQFHAKAGIIQSQVTRIHRMETSNYIDTTTLAVKTGQDGKDQDEIDVISNPNAHNDLIVTEVEEISVLEDVAPFSSNNEIERSETGKSLKLESEHKDMTLKTSYDKNLITRVLSFKKLKTVRSSRDFKDAQLFGAASPEPFYKPLKKSKISRISFKIARYFARCIGK